VESIVVVVVPRLSFAGSVESDRVLFEVENKFVENVEDSESQEYKNAQSIQDPNKARGRAESKGLADRHDQHKAQGLPKAPIDEKHGLVESHSLQQSSLQ
jgi:hypothetical protein